MRALCALVLCAACSTASRPDSTCTDGVANGDESDIDCGGSSCQPCADNQACTGPDDCASGVCNATCIAPTCSDGVQNGTELGADCGGPCPRIVDGIGCTMGTGGSMVCTSYTSGDKFEVTITWNAAGGNAYVDYIKAYGPSGEDYNSNGVVGGVPINICTSGVISKTFQLPLGSNYTYKVWHAFCVRDDACSGCGNDTTVMSGGTFGVVPRC